MRKKQYLLHYDLIKQVLYPQFLNFLYILETPK
jgi:hypothetical protein